METRQTGVERELPGGEVEHLGTTVSAGFGLGRALEHPDLPQCAGASLED